jgi:hypothetical protein
MQRKRRSGRIAKKIAIVLLGTDTTGKVLSEETKTVVLSRHGAGVISRYRFSPDELMTLRCPIPPKKPKYGSSGKLTANRAATFTASLSSIPIRISGRWSFLNPSRSNRSDSNYSSNAVFAKPAKISTSTKSKRTSTPSTDTSCVIARNVANPRHGKKPKARFFLSRRDRSLCSSSNQARRSAFRRPNFPLRRRVHEVSILFTLLAILLARSPA